MSLFALSLSLFSIVAAIFLSLAFLKALYYSCCGDNDNLVMLYGRLMGEREGERERESGMHSNCVGCGSIMIRNCVISHLTLCLSVSLSISLCLSLSLSLCLCLSLSLSLCLSPSPPLSLSPYRTREEVKV